MKTAVVITLIISGVVVVAIPPLSDAWRTLMMTRLMEHGVRSVNMEGRLEDIYRIGCWSLGAAMIGVGFAASFIPSVVRNWRSDAQ
jgi:hypothetical protein